MHIKDLLNFWQSQAESDNKTHLFTIKLPLKEAAKVAALTELYPARSQEDILQDLITASLSELEEGMPYIPGQEVISEDDQGDPIYKDIGLTPQFHELKQKYLKALLDQYK